MVDYQIPHAEPIPTHPSDPPFHDPLSANGSHPCPTSIPPSTPHDSTSDDLVHAARAYQKEARSEAANVFDVDHWCDQFAGKRSCAELFRDLHRIDSALADRLADSLTQMPLAGEEVCGFTLEAELGRGAFGRVYLVRQENLADRRVVLKLAADVWTEARILARLQHTHIMPVYSVHQLSPHSAVCMPYLGATTLEDVLRSIRGHRALPRSGGALIQTIRHRQAITIHTISPVPDIGHREPLPWPMPPLFDTATESVAEETRSGSPAMRLLRKLSYVDAIVWIATRLADGLAHAHEHGVIHRDLKPANVLLTDDGQPMLLDFNVADDVRLRGCPTAIRVGGTLPYMSPEHFEAFRDRNACLVPGSDIYSLGVILYELLTGQSLFGNGTGTPSEVFAKARAERQQPPPRLRDHNPSISPAVEAIVRKCLEPNLAHRYQDARQLQEDLERHRIDQPLRFAANTSPSEAIAKWCRRHPKLTSSASVATVALAAMTFLMLLVLGYGWQLAAIEERQQALTAWQLFQDDASSVRFLLYTRATEPEQRSQGIDQGLAVLDRYGIGRDPLWDKAPQVLALPEEDQAQLHILAGELLLLLSRATVLKADEMSAAEQPAEFATASRLAALAETCDPSLAQTPALARQRAELASKMGNQDEAARLRKAAKDLPLQTARDLYWLALTDFAHGRPGEALPLLRDAVHREPNNFWAWFVLANCHDRLGQDARAEACYDTCIALMPDFAWGHFNRGLALLRQRDHARAIVAFDETLQRKPNLTEALINRALAYQGLGQNQEAIADLTLALESGSKETRVYFLRSRLKDKTGDVEGAKADFDEGLKQEPSDEKSWLARGMARLNREPDKALMDFEKALRINPRSLQAWQNKSHVLAEKLNRPEDALAASEKAVAVSPESASARSGRGVLLARLNKPKEALTDAEEALLLEPTAARQYQAACIYALTSANQPDDRPRALQLLQSALRQGFGLDLVETDHDLDPLRKLPEFRRLVEAARALRPPDPLDERSRSWTR